jgi:hypothetical protein
VTIPAAARRDLPVTSSASAAGDPAALSRVEIALAFNDAVNNLSEEAAVG